MPKVHNPRECTCRKCHDILVDSLDSMMFFSDEEKHELENLDKHNVSVISQKSIEGNLKLQNEEFWRLCIEISTISLLLPSEIKQQIMFRFMSPTRRIRFCNQLLKRDVVTSYDIANLTYKELS